MVNGGDLACSLAWDDLSNTISRRGTIISTARSERFHKREGIKDAVASLISNGIGRLVFIEGDDSLSGTEELR